MSKLLELAERCEAATVEQQRNLLVAAYHLARGPTPELGMAVHDPFFRMLNANAFESAAMTLVPEGWDWFVQSKGEVSGTPLAAVWTHGGIPSFRCEATSEALALCAAALRAQASIDTALNGEGDGG